MFPRTAPIRLATRNASLAAALQLVSLPALASGVGPVLLARILYPTVIRLLGGH